MNTNTNTLNALAGRLGLGDTIELLELALPLIAEREQEIRQSLLAGDWSEAARCAHKTMSSVRLYGTHKLELLLRQVQSAGQGQMDVPAFQQELSAEFVAVMQTISEWLAKHATGQPPVSAFAFRQVYSG